MTARQSSMQFQDDVILTDPHGPHKPRGILDAISEIQQYYTVEKGGSNIPEDFLTVKGKVSFFMVGFRDSRRFHLQRGQATGRGAAEREGVGIMWKREDNG